MSTAALTLSPTTDVALLDSIAKHPAVFPALCDDATPPRDQLTLDPVVRNSRHVFLAVTLDATPAGFFWFSPDENCETYEVHTVLLPRCRGRTALDAIAQAVKWLFAHTSATAIRTYALDTHRPAMLMARLAGMHLIGRRPHPHTVGGQQRTQVWFELPRAQRA